MTPNDRKYAESHEWVKMVDDTATIGISDHAQESLGDITFVELPTVGDHVEAGKECGVIESVKAASDLYSPVTGQISEVNTELDTTPEQINNAPYETGWIFKVSGASESETASLMDADAYEKFLESQE